MRAEFGVYRIEDFKSIGFVVFDFRRPPFILGDDKFNYAPGFAVFPIRFLGPNSGPARDRDEPNPPQFGASLGQT
jgi:hypothetical protein